MKKIFKLKSELDLEFNDLKSRYLENKQHIEHKDVLKALEDGFDFATSFQKFPDEKPSYYTEVLVVDKNGHNYVAWLAVSDDGSFIWTISTTNIIVKNIVYWKYI